MSARFVAGPRKQDWGGRPAGFAVHGAGLCAGPPQARLSQVCGAAAAWPSEVCTPPLGPTFSPGGGLPLLHGDPLLLAPVHLSGGSQRVAQGQEGQHPFSSPFPDLLPRNQALWGCGWGRGGGC